MFNFIVDLTAIVIFECSNRTYNCVSMDTDDPMYKLYKI